METSVPLQEPPAVVDPEPNLILISTAVEPEATASTSTDPEPTTSTSTNPEPESIDPELLQALGEFVPESMEWGDDINDNLAKILEPILKSGLKKEVKEELHKKYLLPRNCPLSKPPILNPEIAAVLQDSAKSRDAKLLHKQDQLSRTLSVLGKTITGILTKSLETTTTLKLLSDAIKLIADSHFTETETRRILITPMLEKSFIESFKDRKRDSHLFGDKLSEFIKSSTGIRKTGQLIQAVPAYSQNLNWKGPSPRQQQRNPRAYAGRSGGPRLPPPPAPARRRLPAAAVTAPGPPPHPTQRSAPAPAARRTYAPPPVRRR